MAHTISVPLDTPLSPRVQEQLEQAVRDVLAGLSQSEIEHVRELPPPRQEPFDLACAPELDCLTVSSPPDEGVVGVDLHFGSEPSGEVPIVPDRITQPVNERPERAVGESPTYLTELGGGYADLSTAVVRTLFAYCDAPERDPELMVLGDEPDLLCTASHESGPVFSIYVRYPEYVAEIYGEGRSDLAWRLGMPF